jgi:hypothetical protein
MPRTHEVAADILAGTDQIPGSLLAHARDRHLDDLTQVQQTGQMQRVAGIGLDPVPGRPLQLRRRRDPTLDPGSGQEPR